MKYPEQFIIDFYYSYLLFFTVLVLCSGRTVYLLVDE